MSIMVVPSPKYFLALKDQDTPAIGPNGDLDKEAYRKREIDGKVIIRAGSQCRGRC